jgi:pimeloyl-ACP methyl ester carboxylesterase
LAKKEIFYKNHKFEIAYDILNFSNSKTIIFLHGWGASRSIMKRIFSPHFSDYKQLYIDLIGFGDSGDTAIPLDSYDYKEIIEILLKEISFQKNTIIGHSFGGKIATLLKPKNLILLSSSGIIEEKSIFLKAKISIFKIFRFIGFSFVRRFFIAKDVKGLSKNMYETFKNVIKEDFRQEFANSKAEKVLIFWGEEDTATPIKNGKIINSLIPNSKFYRVTGDHFFFVNHRDFIANKIKKVI